MNIVALISGNGSNLQAIIDAINDGLAVNINAVISDNADAYGLARAQAAGIPTKVLPANNFAEREAFDQALIEVLKQYDPDLIVLAGFMRILGEEVIKAYPDKIINIHPSLLPKHPGLHTHKKVLAANERSHGVSIHFVNNVLDGGPMVAQAAFKVNPGDTIDSLEERAHALEHAMYPQVIKWLSKQLFSENI